MLPAAIFGAANQSAYLRTMLQVAALNTGSNGNCFYVGNHQEAVLIDAGISCREIEKRMRRLELDMGRVRAVFITHEHTDHICGLATLTKKYQLPVYITPLTLQHSRLALDTRWVRPFLANKPVKVGAMQVKPFRKVHDAIDPHSFMISCQGIHVGVITDIGHHSREVISHFKQCHAVFLESNYCEDMLWKGSYPYPLKKRISGGQGHISNRQALELFMDHRVKQLTHLFLSHLSGNNNTPELVYDLFRPYQHLARIVVASRHEETPLYWIGETGSTGPVRQQHAQLSLF